MSNNAYCVHQQLLIELVQLESTQRTHKMKTAKHYVKVEVLIPSISNY